MFEITDNVLTCYTGTESYVVIPSHVTDIDTECFARNLFIRTVVMPPQLRRIGLSAFLECRNLETVIFSNESREVRIELFAFSDCDKLKEINLEHVTYIDEGSFCQCSKLRKVSIAESAVVKGAAFVECHLDEVDFGTRTDFSSIHDSALLREGRRCIICHGAMDDHPELGGMRCTVCGQLHSYKNMADWNSFIIENTTCVEYRGYGSHLPDGIKKIAYRAFDDAVVSYLDLSSSDVEEIEDEAFLWCDFALNPSLPRNLKRIGKKAFISTNLTHLLLPEKVIHVGDDCFSSCEDLKKIDLGNVRFLGVNAFLNCTALEEVRIPDSCLLLGPGAFLGCKNLSTVRLPKHFERMDLSKVFPKHTTLIFED